MKCPKCSHENDENALYCNKCGIKFDKKQDWNSILIMAYCFSIIFLAITNACIGYLFDWIGCTWQTKAFCLSVPEYHRCIAHICPALRYPQHLDEGCIIHPDCHCRNNQHLEEYLCNYRDIQHRILRQYRKNIDQKDGRIKILHYLCSANGLVPAC